MVYWKKNFLRMCIWAIERYLLRLGILHWALEHVTIASLVLFFSLLSLHHQGHLLPIPTYSWVFLPLLFLRWLLKSDAVVGPLHPCVVCASSVHVRGHCGKGDLQVASDCESAKKQRHLPGFSKKIFFSTCLLWAQAFSFAKCVSKPTSTDIRE